MDEETQKIIAEQMKQLPSDVREAIISVDYQTKLQEITKRQKLLIDQAGKLEMETTLVMIGLEPLSDYIDNLQRELGVPEERAKEIALDVSQNIFKSIRDSLRQMSEDVNYEEEFIGPNDIPDDEVIDSRADKILGQKEIPPRFTNSNEVNLNRDQLLREIEDPSLIEGGEIRNIDQIKETPQEPEEVSTSIAIKIPHEHEIETIPSKTVTDIHKDILTTKMTSTTNISRQIVDVKPEIKLPEIEKKKPTSGIDPYREPIN